ncbi:hypothetical protein mru_0736 [Methanobrevibacter ruminantium M1]|uniref:Uncharacterized protein n=1 Tax=Methanobrevibacter ruminantium (strain ATCC 35063 / DSM 1093 / JCM 13430 / OCM 146 / M1) TaxID=634498 RepID=D3E226_METRM|nr:hypothetical protein [Methanobrevibacter ruminantium]ADC46587.1 hypothetical protein mru_0736 [Methanobrevibacter ruminantium M1]
MSKKEDNCQIDDCSSGTCAPVSPFSKEGILFLIFIIVLFIVLFFLLWTNGLI